MSIHQHFDIVRSTVQQISAGASLSEPLPEGINFLPIFGDLFQSSLDNGLVPRYPVTYCAFIYIMLCYIV